jgi:hypothetical protein
MAAPNFEDLGPEPFQRFCQALLVRDHPTLQCLPVAQPDGGRDAFTAVAIFQVKFARNPSALTDVVKWVTDAVRGELEKVKRLAGRGAERYVLLTNVPGTAHLDVGRVDRVQAYLNDNVPIPAMCLWRDDLVARLENAPSLYWAYPTLLDAGHLLQWFVERADPDTQRRTGTIKTYLEETYRDDQLIRFRQVELENHLLDLYVDVPIVPKPTGTAKPAQFSPLQRRVLDRERSIQEATVLGGDDPTTHFFWVGHLQTFIYRNLSAASLLLNEPVASETADVVIEGAPGQGKSTVAQYICQVHRIRLLEKERDLTLVPDDHKRAPLRVPFKIDLRDLATWIRGQDPFRPDHLALPQNHPQSLESLIGWHVEYKTGGRKFTVDDVHAAATVNPILLVLDGLDEVADIALRRKVIDEANAGISRLRSSAMSLQVVATSRPAVFSNSPGFPERRFAYLQLSHLTPDLVHEYASKWCAVSRASDVDRKLIFDALNTKLVQPHIRDLSRNAMQMAILLNLISTLGESLPDARTALYDEYMKLFLRREAEKNTIIAKHRTLIIDIHRYLAWVLQTGAEGENPQGTISETALKTLLGEYLEREGRDPGLVDELFQGILERVVALVKRIEGLFEFDVQPLREYFCARFLYDTAPSSSVGRATSGSRPDRFDGVSRNPYWLNVTRFFAGCHTKGELAGLKESLYDLRADSAFRLTSYPRQLAFLLLSDWVFEQSPKATEEVVALLLDDLGSRHCVTDNDLLRGSQRLADECGRRMLFDRCFELLSGGIASDRESAVSSLAVANSSHMELAARWADIASDTSNLSEWFRIGARCSRHCFDRTEVVDELLGEGVERERRLQYVAESGAAEYFLRSDTLVDTFTDLAMSKGVMWPIGREPAGRTVLDAFGLVTTICRRLPTRGGSGVHVRRFMQDLVNHESMRGVDGWGASSAHLERIGVCVEQVTSFISDSGLISHTLEPWQGIEAALSPFARSESWFLYELALRACAIRCKERPVGGDALFDHATPVTLRARCARLRSGSPNWWRNTLSSSDTVLEHRFALALLLGWGTKRTISLLSTELNDVLGELSAEEFLELVKVLQFMNSLDETPRYDLASLRGHDIRLVIALAQRMATYTQVRSVLRILERYRGDDPTVAVVRRRLQVESASRMPAVEAITIISREYEARLGSAWPNPKQLKEFDVGVAETILSNPGRYPLSYSQAAEEVCRRAISGEIVPVALKAEQEGWFHIAG